VTSWSSLSAASDRDDIVGYRTFVAVIAAAYFTLIALTPRSSMMRAVDWGQLLPVSALYLVLGIWGFDFARRRRNVWISLAYLLIEFAIGMRINTIAWEGSRHPDTVGGFPSVGPPEPAWRRSAPPFPRRRS